MEEFNPFITVLIFVSGLTLAESIMLMAKGRRRMSRLRTARGRLKRHANRIQKMREKDRASILIHVPKRGPILTLMTKLIPDRRPLDLWLYRAGSPMQLEVFIGLSVLFSLIGFSIGSTILGEPALASGLGLTGILPFLYVRYQKNKRLSTFEAEFPSALELLSRSLKAGHPIHVALRVVSEESEEPVASELSQVVDEMSMGLDPRTALQNLALRINTQDVPFFVTAMLIQRETGGDLPRVLEGLAKTTRERNMFHTKVKAIVSQTKLSANFLALIPVGFLALVSVLAPEYLKPLYEDGPGSFILPAAGTLTLVGWVLCRKFTSVEV